MVSQRRIQALRTGLKLLRGLLLIALPIMVAGIWLTVPQPPDLSAPILEGAHRETPEQTARDLAWYAPLWERDLKQPPIPPPVSEPQERSVDTGPLPTLLATLIEPEGRYAHFAGPSGRARLKSVDETIDRFRVRAIEPGRVQLEDNGQIIWVEIPRPKGER